MDYQLSDSEVEYETDNAKFRLTVAVYQTLWHASK